MSDHDIERLPKWAQREIETLRMRVEEWKAKATVGPEDSDTFLWTGGIRGEDKPLGKSVHVKFRYGQRWHHEFDVSLRENGELYVSGGDGLVIAPYSANVVRLRIER